MLSRRKSSVARYAALLLALSVVSHAAVGQSRIYKLGILNGGAPPPSGQKYTFVRKLEELGFVEGRNLAIEARAANYEYGNLGRLADELVRSKMDVIVGVGPSSIAAAVEATRTIPIVMMYSGDPVALGLVKNLARPGGNVTGNGWEQDDRQIAKTIGLLREVAPRMNRVAFVWHLDNRSHPHYERIFREAALGMGLQVASFGLRRGAEIPRTLRQLEEARPDAIVVFADVITVMYEKEIGALIRRNRVPAVVTSYSPGAFEDAVMFYGPNVAEFPARTAEYVARIFRGARPGDLPIVLPSKWELVVNRRSASSLGIAIPQSILLRADEVLD